MPNPFVKSGQVNTSRTPPQRLDPVVLPVAEEDTNVPYLGQNFHGGPDASSEHFNEELDEDLYQEGDVVYDIPDEEQAVPVRIVGSDSGSEIKAFRVFRAYAPNDIPTSIVNRHDKRQAVKIKNLGSNKVWIGSDNSSASPVNGYPLDAGAEVSISATTDVWGVAERKAQVGGWVNLIPRQVVANNVNFVGASFDAKDFTNARLVLKVYSVAGTTPTIGGSLLGVAPDGTGYTINATGNRTTAGTTTTAVPVIDSERVMGSFVLSTGTADQSIDAELWAFFEPYSAAGPTDPTPLAIWYDYSLPTGD